MRTRYATGQKVIKQPDTPLRNSDKTSQPLTLSLRHALQNAPGSLRRVTHRARVAERGGGTGSPRGWGGLGSPPPKAPQIRPLPRRPKPILPIKPQPLLQSWGEDRSIRIFLGVFRLPADPRQRCGESLVRKRERRGRVYGRKKKMGKKARFCSHSENSNSTPARRQRRLLHAAPRIKCFCFIFNTQSLLVLSCRSSPLPPTCIRSQWHPCQEN